MNCELFLPEIPQATNYTPATSPEISCLPAELIALIFNHIPIESISSTILVCKNWHQITIDAIRIKQHYLVKKFIDFIVNIDREQVNSPEQQKILESIHNDKSILTARTWGDIKKSILQLEEECLSLLTTLTGPKHLSVISEFANRIVYKDTKLDACMTTPHDALYKKMPLPLFFDNIFHQSLLIILRKSSRDRAMDIEIAIDEAVLKTSSLMADIYLINGNFLEALVSIKGLARSTILHQYSRTTDEYYHIIGLKLEQQNWRQACGFVSKIKDKSIKERLFNQIFDGLLERKQIREAHEMIDLSSEIPAEIIIALKKALKQVNTEI